MSDTYQFPSSKTKVFISTSPEEVTPYLARELSPISAKYILGELEHFIVNSPAKRFVVIV